MAAKNSYTFVLTPEQQDALEQLLASGNYLSREVPHTRIAVEADRCKVMLYSSGKCLVQGKGATDWVQFILEPLVLMEVRTGYEEVLNPQAFQPHMGIDESGKGDFFGPMVIAAVFSDDGLAHKFNEMGVKDSKAISSDTKAFGLDRELRKLLDRKFALVTIGPKAYNRLYTKMRSVNSILAWGHARAIENLLGLVPDCTRAVADQFGPKRQIEQALMRKGRTIELEQRPKAESDPAVAAASILARASFLRALEKLKKEHGHEFPKGASEKVRKQAEILVKGKGPGVLLDTAKCHFRTADQVLEAVGHRRDELGPEAVSKSRT